MNPQVWDPTRHAVCPRADLVEIPGLGLPVIPVRLREGEDGRWFLLDSWTSTSYRLDDPKHRSILSTVESAIELHEFVEALRIACCRQEESATGDLTESITHSAFSRARDAVEILRAESFDDGVIAKALQELHADPGTYEAYGVEVLDLSSLVGESAEGPSW